MYARNFVKSRKCKCQNSICHIITKSASLCSVQIFRLFLLWVKKGGSKRVKWDDIISGLKCEVSWSFSRLLLHIYAPRQNSSNRGSHYWYQTNTRLWAQVMAIWLVKFPEKGYKIRFWPKIYILYTCYYMLQLVYFLSYFSLRIIYQSG